MSGRTILFDHKGTDNRYLSIEQFKAMDHRAVTRYHLHIEFMMENRGMVLARFIAYYATKGRWHLGPAAKTGLIQSGIRSEIYIADIGIPVQLYKELGISQFD